MQNHVLITGTGRSGTTFLMELLTVLNLDTGYVTSQISQSIAPGSRCGMELTTKLTSKMPYIVKSPFFCTQIDEIISDGLLIDCLIVPIRNLKDAASSRRKVYNETSTPYSPGSLFGTTDPQKQEEYLTFCIYQLIFTATKHSIPLILLHFPRIITDWSYLYQKLIPILNNIGTEQFFSAFTSVSKPNLISDFGDKN